MARFCCFIPGEGRFYLNLKMFFPKLIFKETFMAQQFPILLIAVCSIITPKHETILKNTIHLHKEETEWGETIKKNWKVFVSFSFNLNLIKSPTLKMRKDPIKKTNCFGYYASYYLVMKRKDAKKRKFEIKSTKITHIL